MNSRLDEGRDWLASMANINRTAETDEIAKVVLFLASDDCTFMHGADVVIDGGSLLQ